MAIQTYFAYLPGTTLIEFVIIGIVAGIFFDVCLRGKSFGFIGNSLIGIVGAVVGGFVWEKTLKNYIKIDLGSATIQLNMVLVALLGTVLLLVLVNMIMKKKRD